MKKFFLVPVILAILLTGCKSIYLSELKPTPKNTKLLPPLEPIVNIESLESAYSSGSSVVEVSKYNTRPSNSTFLGIASSTSTIYKDKRIQDAITIFERDVTDNISNPFGEKKGSITCRIVAGEQSMKDNWVWATAFSAFTLNLFGIPLYSSVTNIDVEVDIYSKNNNLIGKYSATGYSKVWVALYWGYDETSASRKSAYSAFKLALNEIKLKIQDDNERLTLELNEKLN
jgi:hypothetical protein